MPNPTRHPPAPGSPATEEESPKTGKLIVGATTLSESEPVPVSVDLSASVPGIKFVGNVSSNQGVAGIDLRLRRDRSVIAVSIIIMVMMMCLAISILAMTLHALNAGETALLSPLSAALALIFGTGTSQRTARRATAGCIR